MKKLLMIILSFLGLSACAQDKPYADMTVPEFAKYIKEGGVQLLDVRTPEEFSGGHIAGAKNINVYDNDFVEQVSKTLDKSRPVAVYCRSGKRSADAAAKLAAKGYKVTNLKGGILAWEEAEKPIDKK